MLYLVLILSVLLVISIYFCVKFALIIINIQETIEDCLDILDEKYAIISNILNIPIFYESREIREVLARIKESRDAILLIAQKLSSKNYDKEIEENGNNEEE
jgi:hypothetical protein